MYICKTGDFGNKLFCLCLIYCRGCVHMKDWEFWQQSFWFMFVLLLRLCKNVGSWNFGKELKTLLLMYIQQPFSQTIYIYIYIYIFISSCIPISLSLSIFPSLSIHICIYIYIYISHLIWKCAFVFMFVFFLGCVHMQYWKFCKLSFMFIYVLL